MHLVSLYPLILWTLEREWLEKCPHSSSILVIFLHCALTFPISNTSCTLYMATLSLSILNFYNLTYYLPYLFSCVSDSLSLSLFTITRHNFTPLALFLFVPNLPNLYLPVYLSPIPSPSLPCTYQHLSQIIFSPTFSPIFSSFRYLETHPLDPLTAKS